MADHRAGARAEQRASGLAAAMRHGVAEQAPRDRAIERVTIGLVALRVFAAAGERGGGRDRCRTESQHEADGEGGEGLHGSGFLWSVTYAYSRNLGGEYVACPH